MYNDDRNIFNSYVQHRKQFILESNIAEFYKEDHIQQIHDLYKYDIDCISEMLEEGMIGDAFGKVAGGVKSAAKFVATKGVEMLLGLIKKTATPEELQEIQQRAEDLKDPQKAKALASQAMQTINSSAEQTPEQASEQPATNNESVYSNKRFLARNIVTESNLVRLLERYSFVTEQILEEARAPKPQLSDKERKAKAKATAAKRSAAGKKGQAAAPYGSRAPKADAAQQQTRGKGTLTQYAKQVAAELKNRYSKSPAQLQNAFKDFQRILSTKVGAQPATGGSSKFAPKATQMPQRPATSAAGAAGAPPTGAAPAAPATTAGAPPTGVPATAVTSPAGKEGFIRKAVSWIKANPKRTAGTLLGIVAALGLAIGGPLVLIPLLAKAGLVGAGTLGTAAAGAATGAVAGGGIAAAKNIAQQGFSNKEFSGKELLKKAGKGALMGAAGGAAGGLIKGALGTAGAPEETSDDTTDDTTGETPEDTTDHGDSSYTGGTEDVSATPEDFQKYNAEPLDPQSWRDKIKMTALDKFKREGGGSIDANKYNSFVQKLVSLGKSAKGQSIETIMGESYTVGYLNFF